MQNRSITLRSNLSGQIYRRLLAATILATSATPALAQTNCSSVIALSRERNVVAQSEDQLERYARDFCSKYGSSGSSDSGMEVDAAYEALSLSFGQTKASRSQVTSEYCDATDSRKEKSDAYRHYIENIAPGAYDAYKACEELRSTRLEISVDPTAILPRFLIVNAAYPTNDQNASQTLTFVSSPGVRCGWANSSTKNTTIRQNGSDVLSCTRPFDNKPSTVAVFPLTNSRARLTVPWDEYEGRVPVSRIKQLIDLVENMNRSAVVAFRATSCPTGWSDYAPAYGRFIRGIDRSPTPLDPDGTRAVGSLQNDGFGRHDHAQPRVIYDHGSPNPGSVPAGGGQHFGISNPPRSAPEGIGETRPKNVALLYCHRP